MIWDIALIWLVWHIVMPVLALCFMAMIAGLILLFGRGK